MVTLSRALAKRLVSLFSKTLGLQRHSLKRQAVKVLVDQEGLTIESATATHAVRFRDPRYQGLEQQWEAPFEAMMDLAKSSAPSGEFYLQGEAQQALRVVEKSIPRVESYSMPEFVLPTPASPKKGYLPPLAVRKALITAFETSGAPPDGRYALSKVQLRGGKDALVATDGRQLLIHAGLPRPFEEDPLLANYRRLFESGDFPEGPIE